MCALPISTKHANVDRGDSAATLFETIGAEGDTSKDRQLKIEDCTNQASVCQCADEYHSGGNAGPVGHCECGDDRC